MAISETATPATVAQVREIASLISKTAKNYQVYLPNNRMFLSSLEELGGALASFLELNEVLTFVVKEFELLYGDVAVYSNPDKHGSIAFRMYRDGIRLISFHKGITNDELVVFFKAMTKCMESENLEEDFVTLLWEKDLQSITYYEVNDYDPEYEAQKKEATARAAVPHVSPGASLSDAQWTEVARDVERFKPALDLTAGDLQEAANLSFVVEDDLFLKRTWHVLCSTLELDDSKQTYLDLENALTGLLDACVSMKQLGFAADALSETKSQYGPHADQEVQDSLKRIVQSRHSPEKLEFVAEVLESSRESDHDRCLAYLTQLDTTAIPSVVGLLPRCPHQSARQVIVMSLAALANSDPAELVRCTAQAPPDEADLALDALAAIGTGEALSSAMGLSHHASPRVRAKVAFLAGRLPNGSGLDVATALVQDQDPGVRKHAMSSLVEIGGEKCAEILTGLFTSREFSTLSHDRKTSMLLVIKKLPPDDQRQVMRTIMQMRSFWGRKALEDTKASLMDIMHLMDRDVACELLDHAARHSSHAMRKAAAAALRKVNDDKRVH